MSAELTPEVIDRLTADHYGWLTTVAKSGQPVPKLIWFYFDGAAVVIYTVPGAAKVAHVQRHPRVSLNLDSEATAAASS
jgi:PPOX class probable F420-dependent enzyme